jgi:hypothetical protein
LATRWLNAVQEVAVTAFVTVGTAVIGYFVPAWLRPWIMGQRVDQLLRNAALSAIARTKDAAKGQTVTVPVMNEMLGRAMKYANDQAPTVVDWAAKGAVSLAKMLLARFADLGVVPKDYTTEKAEEVAIDFATATKKSMGGG